MPPWSVGGISVIRVSADAHLYGATSFNHNPDPNVYGYDTSYVNPTWGSESHITTSPYLGLYTFNMDVVGGEEYAVMAYALAATYDGSELIDPQPTIRMNLRMSPVSTDGSRPAYVTIPSAALSSPTPAEKFAPYLQTHAADPGYLNNPPDPALIPSYFPANEWDSHDYVWGPSWPTLWWKFTPPTSGIVRFDNFLSVIL